LLLVSLAGQTLTPPHVRVWPVRLASGAVYAISVYP